MYVCIYIYSMYHAMVPQRFDLFPTSRLRQGTGATHFRRRLRMEPKVRHAWNRQVEAPQVVDEG